MQSGTMHEFIMQFLLHYQHSDRKYDDKDIQSLLELFICENDVGDLEVVVVFVIHS